jgi:hypothetical protein
MGFVRRKQYKLHNHFQDPELAGLEVVAEPLPVGEHMVLLLTCQSRPGQTAQEVAEWVGKMSALLAEAIEVWNLEDRTGRPVPVTAEAVATLDQDFLYELAGAYFRASSEVPAPLEQPSSGGGPSLEASLPMETLSSSPPS